MGIRSKFQGKNCILKAVLKKNATVVVKVCPKNYLFCIPTNFLPQLFYIFTQIYLPYLWHYATLSANDFEEDDLFRKMLLARSQFQYFYGPLAQQEKRRNMFGKWQKFASISSGYQVRDTAARFQKIKNTQMKLKTYKNTEMKIQKYTNKSTKMKIHK